MGGRAGGRPAAGRHGRRRGGPAASRTHLTPPSPPPLSACVAAYGINSILYQRGIYPPETFTRVQKYGLTLLVTTDPELKNYLNNVVEQMKGGGRGRGDERAPANRWREAAVPLLMVLVFLALQLTAVASYRVAVQVHRAAPGGGHLEYREQRGSGAVAVRHRV